MTDQPTIERRVRALERALWHLLQAELKTVDPGDRPQRCPYCRRIGLHWDDCAWLLAREALGIG